MPDRIAILRVFCAAAALLWTAVLSLPARADDALRVLLNWTPTSNYAAFYVAEDDGLYARAHLSAGFTHTGQNADSMRQVASGEADIGVGSAEEVIAGRAAGLHVKAIAALFQRSPIVFISKPEYNITRPEQVAGQTVRVTSEIAPVLEVMLASANVPPKSWTPATLPSDPALFETGPAHVWGVYVNGLPLQLQARGQAFNVLYPEDYGVSTYGSVIFVREALLAQKPGPLRAFVAATLEGLRRAIEEPDRAVASAVKRNPALEPAQEQMRFISVIPLFHTGLGPLGTMDEATWSHAIQIATVAGIATDTIQVPDLFTTALLPSR